MEQVIHSLIRAVQPDTLKKEALMDGYFQQVGDRVADHMTKDVDVVKQDDDIIICADYFYKGRRRLPVLDDGKLVGIVSIGDVVKRLLEKYEQEAELIKQFINS